MNDLRPNDFDTHGSARTLAQCYAAAVAGELAGAELLEAGDVVRLAWGDMEGIVALVTPEALELRLPTIEWPHPHEPRRSSRLWRRVEWQAIPDRPALSTLIQEAIAARQAESRVCRFCDRSFMPEHMMKDDVCHGCAEEHLGIVF